MFTIIWFVTLLAAYPMSKKEFVGRNFFNVIFHYHVFFGENDPDFYPDQSAVSGKYNLGNLSFPGAFNVWNMILARTTSVYPHELRECILPLTVLITKIMMPVCKPIIGACIRSFRWFCLSYFDAMIYLNDAKTAAIAAGTSFHPCNRIHRSPLNIADIQSTAQMAKGSGTSCNGCSFGIIQINHSVKQLFHIPTK